MYTIKSDYWVVKNILTKENDTIYSESSTTKLQEFSWKIKAPPKICHLIWQIISRHLAVTRNLKRRYIDVIIIVLDE